MLVDFRWFSVRHVLFGSHEVSEDVHGYSLIVHWLLVTVRWFYTQPSRCLWKGSPCRGISVNAIWDNLGWSGTCGDEEWGGMQCSSSLLNQPFLNLRTLSCSEYNCPSVGQATAREREMLSLPMHTLYRIYIYIYIHCSSCCTLLRLFACSWGVHWSGTVKWVQLTCSNDSVPGRCAASFPE